MPGLVVFTLRKSKPKQIWIGVNAKGTGFFTGVKPAQPQQKPSGKPVAGKPVKPIKTF